MDFASQPVYRRRKSLIWARRAREEQGLYEVEISFGGEADLHNSFVLCDKNPGHKNFTPLEVFSLHHLPLQYRDETVLDLIKAVGDLTVRITVDHTSNERWKCGPSTSTSFPVYFFRDVMMRTGTGWVYRIFRFGNENERNCQCKGCKGSDRPFRQWGEIWIVTATHVVFDSSEAEHTTCDFFYDACNKDSDQVLKLKGMELVINDVTADWCNLKYVTHDCEVLDRIERLYTRYEKLHKEVYEKVKNNYFDKELNSADNFPVSEPTREDSTMNSPSPSDIGNCTANLALNSLGTKKANNSGPCTTCTPTEPGHSKCPDNNDDIESAWGCCGSDSSHTSRPTASVRQNSHNSPTANEQTVKPLDFCTEIPNTYEYTTVSEVKSENVSTSNDQNETGSNSSHDEPHTITTPSGPPERNTPPGNDQNEPSLDHSSGNAHINTIPIRPEPGNSPTSEPPSDHCPGHSHDRWPIAPTGLAPENFQTSTNLNKANLNQDSFEKSSDSCAQPKLTFIVSHPHGQNKQVTIGEWVEKQITQPMPRLRMTQYTYTTPTCPGSSGAPVYILGRPHWLKCEHPHSGRCTEKGVNQSGYGWDPEEETEFCVIDQYGYENMKNLDLGQLH